MKLFLLLLCNLVCYNKIGGFIMNPIERIDYYKNSFTKSDLLISEWIRKHQNEVVAYSIEELAKTSKTSKAAIIRFSKKIGYNGFAEFKFELSRYIISGEREIEKDKEMNTIKSITSLYSAYIKQLSETIQLNDVQLIAEAMSNARRVKLIGFNRTGLAAKQFRLRMAKIDFEAEAITDPVLLSQLEDNLSEKDLCLFFTTRANTKKYYDFCKKMRKNNVNLIIISCTKTPLLDESDKYLLLPSVAQATTSSFLDDQAIIFVFIEILLAELAFTIRKKS